MTIRAICTDIDGTLLDSRRELSNKTIATFKALNDRIPVILASSRMPAAMRHLQAQLNVLHHPLICYNGGYVIHYTNDSSPAQVFNTTRISATLGASIFALSKGTDIHVSLYHEDEWIAPKVDYWTEREQKITKVNARIGNVSAVLEEWERNQSGAHKLMCMGPESEIHFMEQQLNERFSNHIHIYRSRPTYLELAPKSISKATALDLLLQKHYGLQLADTMAFGDNYNDIEMLQSAGLGIAVDNARDEVKAVANEITLKSTDDGVAASIEKYCL